MRWLDPVPLSGNGWLDDPPKPAGAEARRYDAGAPQHPVAEHRARLPLYAGTHVRGKRLLP